MTRVAVVDCGTNSTRLLLTDVDPVTGGLTELDRRMEITRLGQGVDRTGRFDPDALWRTLGVLSEYEKAARRCDIPTGGDAPSVRVAATSATRDAANRAEFVHEVHRLFGVDPEVLTGEQEAALSFVGATRELVDEPKPHLMVDIGGGSTEFMLGSGDSPRDGASISVDMGCVRMTERHFHDDPPTPEQVESAVAEIDEVLDRVGAVVPLQRAATVVGVAGTVTTVAGIVLELPEYDPARNHLARIPVTEAYAISGRLLGMTHHERAAIPVLHPGRVDVIGAGALILARTMRRIGLPELIASEHDILDGLALSLVS